MKNIFNALLLGASFSFGSYAPASTPGIVAKQELIDTAFAQAKDITHQNIKQKLLSLSISFWLSETGLQNIFGQDNLNIYSDHQDLDHKGFLEKLPEFAIMVKNAMKNFIEENRQNDEKLVNFFCVYRFIENVMANFSTQVLGAPQEEHPYFYIFRKSFLIIVAFKKSIEENLFGSYITQPSLLPTVESFVEKCKNYGL